MPAQTTNLTTAPIFRSEEELASLPASQRIRYRLVGAECRYHANDNIAAFVREGELTELKAEVQAKMVDGAIAKFAKENALLSQVFVMDNKTPIQQVVDQAGKDAGAKIVLKDYVRFQLGEGIEKEESDFAAEVAAMAG